ncbi:TOBE domain family [Synechococcus sp. PCC 7335]|uniref:ABC transporter ATP-binding protein n=1 Tax=Synechococcus sp. (strain ATCC 29403 / PCC 7335) TaxID=91464 RepID=UPI00017EB4F7|nr:ABC transporter ATP-binding protein [Synechococcus sp. PCC 7335]EDX85485.1 TOBE domain family [Synechococcus sp. PCC 7335]
MASVLLKNITKIFPPEAATKAEARPRDIDRPVLENINLTIADGEFMVLVGPSGCGKSTLLRLISGLETLTGGEIWVGDRNVDALPPKQRDIAMVFQSYALYPHLSVYDNLAFGLRRARPTTTAQRPSLLSSALVSLTRRLPSALRYQSAAEQQISKRVHSVAKMLQIEALLTRLPKQLSGGQKQRVALGRAMARDPQVFLMDEPLSNLDAKLRTETRAQIVSLQKELGTTTIYVTHDQTEAMTMGDRIAVMNAGKIQQVDPPLALYRQPANRFVAAFIGSPPMNFLPVTVKAGQLVHPSFTVAVPDDWPLHTYNNQQITLGIRPEHIAVGQTPGAFPATVIQFEALGSETFAVVTLAQSAGSRNVDRAASQSLQVRISADLPIEQGSVLQLSFPTEKIHLFDDESGRAIFSETRSA